MAGWKSTANLSTGTYSWTERGSYGLFALTLKDLRTWAKEMASG